MTLVEGIIISANGSRTLVAGEGYTKVRCLPEPIGVCAPIPVLLPFNSVGKTLVESPGIDPERTLADPVRED